MASEPSNKSGFVRYELSIYTDDKYETFVAINERELAEAWAKHTKCVPNQGQTYTLFMIFADGTRTKCNDILWNILRSETWKLVKDANDTIDAVRKTVSNDQQLLSQRINDLKVASEKSVEELKKQLEEQIVEAKKELKRAADDLMITAVTAEAEREKRFELLSQSAIAAIKTEQQVQVTNLPEPKDNQNMSNVEKIMNSKIVQTVKADGTEAAWRVAGSQLVKLTRDPLVALLTRHLGDDDPSIRAKIAKFLETEIGMALISSIISVCISTVPGVNNDVTSRLAKELRIRALAGVGDLAAEVLMGPLRTIMATYIKDVVPQEIGVRELQENAPDFEEIHVSEEVLNAMGGKLSWPPKRKVDMQSSYGKMIRVMNF